MANTPFDALMSQLAAEGIIKPDIPKPDPEIDDYLRGLDDLIYGDEPQEEQPEDQEDNLQQILDAINAQPAYKTVQLRKFFEKKPDDIITGYSDGAMRAYTHTRLTANGHIMLQLAPLIANHLDLELPDNASLRGSLLPPVNYYFMKNVFIDGCLAADIPLTDSVIELLDLICDIEHRKGTPQLWDIKAKDLGLSGFTDKKLLMLYAMLKDDGDMTGIEDKDIVFNLNPRYAVRKAEPEVVPIPKPVMPQREKTPFDIMLEQLAAARNIAVPAQAKKAVTKLENGILTVADEVVADNAYRGRSDIRKVILLEGVREVGNGAFCSCSNLEAVDVPESLEKLGAEAFSWCTKLKHFDLPGGLKTIGNEAFYRCGGLCSYSGTYEDKELGYDAFFASGIYPEVVAKIHAGILKPCDADGYGARNGTLTGYAELNDPRVGGSRNSGFAQGFNIGQPSGLNPDLIELLKKLGL